MIFYLFPYLVTGTSAWRTWTSKTSQLMGIKWQASCWPWNNTTKQGQMSSNDFCKPLSNQNIYRVIMKYLKNNEICLVKTLAFNNEFIIYNFVYRRFFFFFFQRRRKKKNKCCFVNHQFALKTLGDKL